MAQMFADEKKYPDNAVRKNFVFLGYPFTPPIAKDDYAKVVKELQKELPIRFWYFLDEVTTNELMRKIWRAILRSDLAVFDTSGGNPNVAFELGMALAIEKRCMTVLKTGSPNPLGSADLGYSERIEYSSATTLKEQLRTFVTAQSSALRLLKDVSYPVTEVGAGVSRETVQEKLTQLVLHVFNSRYVTKKKAKEIMGSEALATTACNQLRAEGVLQVEGQKRGARWIFTDHWAYHDHEVSGL